jgi:hypothetical protein
MPQPPSTVRTIDTLQGVRFVLPSHPFLRVAGLVPIVFGTVFAGFAIFWVLGAAGVIGNGAGSGSLLLPLFGFPFVAIGLAIMGVGATLAFGRPEFEIRDDRFRSGIRLGPLRRSKWRPLDAIERFEINRFGTNPSLNAPYVLRVHVGEERPLNVTGSADGAWLERLASTITARIDRGQLAEDPPPIVARERDPELDPEEPAPDIMPADVADPGPPPEGCPLWIEHSPTGPTVFIPPRGMRAKPVPALLGFCLLWMLITNGVGAGFVMGFTRSGGQVFAMLFVGSILVLFEAVGVWLLFYALSLARRRAILDITDAGRTLLVTRSGLRKSTQREIAGADIAAIQVQNSGASINDQPLREVSIKVVGADDIDLMTGAPEPHLQWLARALRHALRAEMAKEQMAK